MAIGSYPAHLKGVVFGHLVHVRWVVVDSWSDWFVLVILHELFSSLAIAHARGDLCCVCHVAGFVVVLDTLLDHESFSEVGHGLLHLGHAAGIQKIGEMRSMENLLLRRSWLTTTLSVKISPVVISLLKLHHSLLQILFVFNQLLHFI